MTVEDDEIILDGMVHAVGRSMGVFYADDGLIESRDSKWIQGSLNLLIGLFQWIGLMKNKLPSLKGWCVSWGQSG